MVRLFVTQWTVAHQGSLSMGFSGKEHWSGLPCPPPGDLPDPGSEPMSLSFPDLQVGSLPRVPPEKLLSFMLLFSFLKPDTCDTSIKYI